MCHDKGELGTATVTNSTFSGNFADFGGGITNDVGATLTVTNSTFSGNTVANGIGGGIAMVAAHGTTATVTNSTFSNGATKPGGKRTATGTRIALRDTEASASSYASASCYHFKAEGQNLALVEAMLKPGEIAAGLAA